MNERGCVFFNFGTKCLNMLLVALFTLRRHYDGAITVFMSEVPDEAGLRHALSSLDLDFRPFSQEDYIHSSLRTMIIERSPYRATLTLDSDLLFCESPEPLWQPLEDAGILVTRFFPNPYGIGGEPGRPGFAYRLGHFQAVAHLVTPEQFERAAGRLLNDSIDINAGVMGSTKPRGDAFLAELSRGIERGRTILLVDESLTNVLIPGFRHNLADESWNCPADEMFRRTHLSDARIAHYFADGQVVDGRRLGRNRATEAGKLWFEAFDEIQEQLPVDRWTGFENLP